MATYKAIAAVGQAIVNLLKDAAGTEFPDAEFKLYQAADFASKRQHLEGASVCLYHIEFPNIIRNTPPGRIPGGSSQVPAMPAMPLNVKFLITPWVSNPEKQYRLLGWILCVLNNNPILTASLLNRIAPNETIFSQDENVKLVIEPVSPADLSMTAQNLKQPEALSSIVYRASIELECTQGRSAGGKSRAKSARKTVK